MDEKEHEPTLADTFAMFFSTPEDACINCGTTENLTERQQFDDVNRHYYICSKCEKEIEAKLERDAVELRRQQDLLNYIGMTDGE